MARKASLPRKSGRKPVYPATFGFGPDRHPIRMENLVIVPEKPLTEDEPSILKRAYNGASMVLNPPRTVSQSRARTLLMAERFGLSRPS